MALSYGSVPGEKNARLLPLAKEAVVTSIVLFFVLRVLEKTFPE